MSGNRGVNTGVIMVDTPVVATEIPKPASKRFGFGGKACKRVFEESTFGGKPFELFQVLNKLQSRHPNRS